MSKISINIKQTLAYGRDVVQAHQKRRIERIDDKIHNQENRIAINDKPTTEWMYEERKKLTASIRYLILKRDNFTCVLCGAKGPDGAKLEIDHIKPLYDWGKTEIINLRTLCKDCNRGKGTIT